MHKETGGLSLKDCLIWKGKGSLLTKFAGLKVPYERNTMIDEAKLSDLSLRGICPVMFQIRRISLHIPDLFY